MMIGPLALVNTANIGVTPGIARKCVPIVAMNVADILVMVNAGIVKNVLGGKI